MTTRRRRRITVTLVKDLSTFGVGLALIIRQGWYVPAADFNLAVLIFGGVLANVPGAAQLWAWRTGGSPSPPPQAEESSPSPSSSGSASAAGDQYETNQGDHGETGAG